MIQSFADRDTLLLFTEVKSRRWSSIAITAGRKLDQLDQARKLTDLLVPAGNQLKQLTGERAGQHSIRVNKQYRICFTWHEEGPRDVEIVDYH